jgi:ABC-type polar amino acid transport system ATPase subunit
MVGGRQVMENTEMKIELTGLRKAFSQRVILDDVSLAVNAGETVALIGPSGGGKSTLLRCINGLNDFDAGAVTVGGHTLRPAPGGSRVNREAVMEIRKRVGMIFQDFQLFPHLTALENVMEAPVQVLKIATAEARERAMTLLQRVGLESHAAKFPGQLSGGQKQRVAIARALAMQPKALLCDEITSALDPELKHEVLEVLEALHGEGLTLIMVTHEIGFARRAADRCVVLDGGKIIEDGPPAQVIDASENERTRQFLSRVMG